MKNTIAVLIVLLLSSHAFAQDNVVYPKFDSRAAIGAACLQLAFRQHDR